MKHFPINRIVKQKISFMIGKFLSQSKSRRSNSPQTLRPAFLVHFTSKKQCARLHGHSGNAYLVIWKVGITLTYASINEEQPGSFAKRILKE